jgi:hypothetical protein
VKLAVASSSKGLNCVDEDIEYAYRRLSFGNEALEWVLAI